MNTKRVLFGMLACAVLVLASCTNDNAKEDDALYDQSIRKEWIKR